MNAKIPTYFRKPVLFGILALNGFLSAWLWWVPIRCVMDGEVFRWANSYGTAHLVGTGVTGHFPILMFLSSFLIVMTYAGWRGAKPPFHAMMLSWSGITFGSTLTSSIMNPEAYRFRGDTLGIDISLAWISPGLWGLLVLMTLALIVVDTNRESFAANPRWNPLNRKLLTVVLSLLPLQFFLLHYGPQHGTTDKVGLILTIFQWILLNAAFMPWGSAQNPEPAVNRVES